MRILLVLCGLLTGCATSSSVTTAEQPINKIHINCAYAGKMSHDLEQIIRNPGIEYPEWRTSFAGLSGYQTSQQRLSSAKTILWSIRTNCRGY